MIEIERFDQLAAFIQDRLTEARSELPANGEAALALDALNYTVMHAHTTIDPRRHGVVTRPSTVLADREDQAWEVLRHIGRHWRHHPDYRSEFALFANEVHA